jgi:hypothetical protein
MTFFAAAVTVSPLAEFGKLSAPTDAHRLLLVVAEHAGAVWS